MLDLELFWFLGLVVELQGRAQISFSRGGCQDVRQDVCQDVCPFMSSQAEYLISVALKVSVQINNNDPGNDQFNSLTAGFSRFMH